MHVHILGICGTFMGGVAALAKAAGHRVTGSDRAIYPPMSEQLAALGIAVAQIDDLAQFDETPDVVVVGNVMSRGAVAVEFMLNQGLAYTSGPAWLADHVLRNRFVIAVAGTHGKTTTAAMTAWLLEEAGMAPGFLIGGVPKNFATSARMGETPFFVVEADEYDCAFFDKRSKFVHYRPRTVVLNNLEFDHADIFADLEAIKTQFHHLIRTVPGSGRIIVNGADQELAEVLARGLWTPTTAFGDAPQSVWRAQTDGTTLTVQYHRETVGELPWAFPGAHNAQNAAAACAAAHDAGVPVDVLMTGLKTYAGVKRRAELVGDAGCVRVFDDFAHHPTAIKMTLAGFKKRGGAGRLLAVLEPRSNTMRMGIHKNALAGALSDADRSWIYRSPDLAFDLDAVAAEAPGASVCTSHEQLIAEVTREARAGDQVVVMSNGSFAGLHGRLLAALSVAADSRSASQG